MMTATTSESTKVTRALLKRFSLLETKLISPKNNGARIKYTGRIHNLPVSPSSVGSGLLRLMKSRRPLTTADKKIVDVYFIFKV